MKGWRLFSICFPPQTRFRPLELVSLFPISSHCQKDSRAHSWRRARLRRVAVRVVDLTFLAVSCFVARPIPGHLRDAVLGQRLVRLVALSALGYRRPHFRPSGLFRSSQALSIFCFLCCSFVSVFYCIK